MNKQIKRYLKKIGIDTGYGIPNGFIEALIESDYIRYVEFLHGEEPSTYHSATDLLSKKELDYIKSIVRNYKIESIGI